MHGGNDFFDAPPHDWRARLELSVGLMRELSLYTDPQAMSQYYALRMGELFPTSRYLMIGRRGLERPEFRVTRCSLWKEPVDPWKEPDRLPLLSGGILAELLYGGQPHIIDDLHVRPDDPAAEYIGGQRSLLAIPHYDGAAALNMVVVTREEPAAFPRERFPELVWMSNLFARAVQSTVLSEALQRSNDVAEHEARSIAQLQQSLLPPAVPDVPTLDLAVHYRTSRRAGGDYYDFFPLPKGRWGILIADVSGHGTPAAVLMAITHSLAKTYTGPPRPPGMLLGYVNHHLAAHYTRPFGTFVTAFYAIYDPAEGTLSYACAGHNPPRMRRARDGSVRALDDAQHLPLGVTEDETYPERTVGLAPGDQLLFYTDGVTEALNPSGERFDTARLDAVLARHPRGAERLLAAVLRELDEFCGPRPPADDRTVIAAELTVAR